MPVFMKRLVAGLLGLVVLATALGAATWVFVLAPANATLPPPDFAAPRDAAEARVQDLTYLRRLPEIDRSFSPEETATFHTEIDRLIGVANSIDGARFEMGVARAIALAGNGHTYLRAAPMGLSLNSLPLRFLWFDDGLFIVAAKVEHADLLGARILRLAGRAPEDLVPELRPYVGGRETRARLFSINFMTSPQALNAIGLAPDPSALDLTLELADGSIAERNVAADTASAASDDAPRSPALDLLPERLPAEDWRHVLAGVKPPLYLQQSGSLYFHAFPTPDTFYVAVRRTRDDEGKQKLGDFLDDALAQARAKRPQTIIVDLRANTGGSYETASTFTRELPKALAEGGRLFILVGPDTFSAGLVLAARLKYFGDGRAMLVGTEMGDDAQFWAEGGRLTLPNSKLMVRYSTAYHDWSKGCGLADISRCHFINYFQGVAAGDLSIELPVSSTFSAYLSGGDPAMDAVARNKGSAQ
ncbi:MAG: hypothetical protein Q8R02_03515 [Hyphomonadaceae bacterium]|nr:hypothetical protein [Hyphomonadaceae bacterium]